MTTLILTIEGMTCGGCTASIQKVLQGLDGVASISVSLEEKNAVIGFDEEKLSSQAIIDAIEEAGFDVTRTA